VLSTLRLTKKRQFKVELASSKRKAKSRRLRRAAKKLLPKKPRRPR